MASPRTQPTASSDERREQVVRATCAVIARDGLDRASMRAIAHELGSTTGVLTHYFRDKDALLAFVLEAIIGSLELGRVNPNDPSLTLRDANGIPRHYLPLGDEERMWWRVWLAFTTAALSDERQSERHRALYAEMRAMWVALLRALKARGELRAELDPAIEADSILCLIDGVGVQALISPEVFSATHQLAVIDGYFRKLAPAK